MNTRAYRETQFLLRTQIESDSLIRQRIHVVWTWIVSEKIFMAMFYVEKSRVSLCCIRPPNRADKSSLEKEEVSRYEIILSIPI
jgi:hypothetical protein